MEAITYTHQGVQGPAQGAYVIACRRSRIIRERQAYLGLLLRFDFGRR